MKKFFVILIALVLAGLSTFFIVNLFGEYKATPSVNDMHTDIETIDEMMVASSNASADDTISLENDMIDTTTLQSSSVAMASSSSSSASSMRAGTAGYASYSSGVIGNGEISLLFFYDKTSSASKATDASLKAMYKLGTPNITTYLVTFDASATLEKKYGITESNTLMLIDGKGVVLKTIVDPTETDLSALLR